jgi:hypothetical protein
MPSSHHVGVGWCSESVAPGLTTPLDSSSSSLHTIIPDFANRRDAYFVDSAHISTDDLEVFIADELELDFPWAEEFSFDDSFSNDSDQSHHNSGDDVLLDRVAHDLACTSLDDSDSCGEGNGGRDEEDDRVDPREIERPKAPLFDGNEDEGEEEEDDECFGERECSSPEIWMDNVPYIDDAEFEMMVSRRKDEGMYWVYCEVELWSERLSFFGKI